MPIVGNRLNLKTDKTETGEIVVTWNDIIRRTNARTEKYLLVIGVLSALFMIWLFFQMWDEGVDTHRMLSAFGEQRRRMIERSEAALAGNLFRIVTFPIIWAFIMGASVLYLRRHRTKSRRIVFNREHMVFEGHRFPLGKISRVAYSSRGQWDSSDFEKNNDAQIRVWFQEDMRSLVVGENRWTNEINHEIQQTLERAIMHFRRAAAEAEQEKLRKDAEASRASFGIPSYD